MLSADRDLIFGNMMDVKPPCKGCEKRTPGCRKECEPWQEYEAEKRKRYADKDDQFRRAEQEWPVRRKRH